MSGILGAAFGPGTNYLDTQTVTVGGIGTAFALDRLRGYLSGSIGSISDGTSNVYAGAAITALYYDEGGGTATYKLIITGAANSGWSQITIGSTTLTRISASYSSGLWTWATSDTIVMQPFGAIGSIRAVYFE